VGEVEPIWMLRQLGQRCLLFDIFMGLL